MRALRVRTHATAPDTGRDAATLAAGRARRAAAQPVPRGAVYPAKEFCSNCGLCDSEWVAHVGEACAFLGSGMSKAHDLEPAVHGRHRKLNDDHELRYGVTASTFFARAAAPIQGAQWTGVVTRLAVAALQAGIVDAVVCVQADPADPLAPRPVVARTAADVIAARGVKPVLSPSLAVLPTLEALAADGAIKAVLFIGVGCQVQAVRAVARYLPCDVFVVGTNCADNGTRAGLATFIKEAAPSPNVAHYEFAQDYRVHFVERGTGETSRVPYFCLPANNLTDAIAPSCYSCFDYTNSLADVVVGYMGVPPPLMGPLNMASHWQHVTVRNDRGARLLAAAKDQLETTPATSWGGPLVAPLVKATLEADDEAKLGNGPDPAPIKVGNIIATLLTWLGPRGLAFGAYSVDYHALRNFLYVKRHWTRGGAKAAAAKHVPPHVAAIVAKYDTDGWLSKRVGLKAPGPPPPRVRE